MKSNWNPNTEEGKERKRKGSRSASLDRQGGEGKEEELKKKKKEATLTGCSHSLHLHHDKHVGRRRPEGTREKKKKKEELPICFLHSVSTIDGDGKSTGEGGRKKKKKKKLLLFQPHSAYPMTGENKWKGREREDSRALFSSICLIQRNRKVNNRGGKKGGNFTYRRIISGMSEEKKKGGEGEHLIIISFLSHFVEIPGRKGKKGKKKDLHYSVFPILLGKERKGEIHISAGFLRCDPRRQ